MFQDYGINVSFSCGISLQQEFDWLLDIPKQKILQEPHNMELYFEEDDFDGFIEALKQYPDIRCFGEGVKEQNWR